MGNLDLPTKESAEQHAAIKVFKYWKETSPFHVNEIFFPPEIRITLGHVWLWRYLWKTVI